MGPLWPYAVLIAIPAAGFILPDLIGGHLLMSGDNVQQNYPLHVLTGSMLRHGQLPLWDQYIFSGSPLLAGFNAGAFYPLVAFFVIFPDRVAWIATEVVLFAGIGIGMYVFVRALALSTIAGLLAAITFAFSGTVLSQVNHLDMTEGFVALPWMFLAVLHIIQDGKWRWAIVLGVGFGLVILGGAPEAMLDEAILVVLYAAFSAGLDRTKWWRVLTRAGPGAALALALSAIQWLPGLDAIANSQRSGLGHGFATSGAFPPVDGLLSLVPYLYGGYGRLGEASFFSSYNLPEVEIYLGVLPIVALLVLWIPSWPSRLAPRERRTWYLLGLVGVLLALGAHTPLEHLFNEIPLYGNQRLQSRNMIDFSVVLSVLLAGWIDRDAASAHKWVVVDRWTACIPLGIVLGLLGLAIADPHWLITVVAGGGGTPLEVHTVRVATIIAAGVCAGALAIVWLRSLLPPRYWMPLVSIFLVADVGLVAATGQLSSPVPNSLLSGTTEAENYIGAHLAPGGRYAVYDPLEYTGASWLSAGIPDVNIIPALPSVGGYSSIVNQTYNDVTQTHTVGELDVPSLKSGAFDQLDLQDILTAPEYFLVPLADQPASLSGVQPISEGQGDPVLPRGANADYHDPYYPYHPAPRASLRAGQVGSWFFGESLEATDASLVFATGAASAEVRFGTLSADGATTWGPVTSTTPGARSVSGAVPSGAAYGMAVQVISGRVPSHQAVVTVHQRAYELDGPLSDALLPGAWHQEGSVEGDPLFVRNRVPMPLRAITHGTQPAPPIQVLSSDANVETIRLHASAPLVVVRDVAWDKGWRASVTVNGGPSRTAPMSSYGLVQQVRLPAGSDVVTFRYRPVHFVAASILSLGALFFLAVLAVVAAVRIRRRRRHPGRRRATATSR